MTCIRNANLFFDGHWQGAAGGCTLAACDSASDPVNRRRDVVNADLDVGGSFEFGPT